MTETMIIRVGQSPEDKLHWLVWSPAESEIIASGELDNAEQLSTLSDKAAGRATLVLFPASCVQLRTQVLPTRWNRKLEQALPYMLEDELACDLEQLFVATGQPVEVDGKPAIEVALCNRSWYENWLDVLQQAGLDPQRILPDALLLPLSEAGNASAIALDGNYLLRTASWQVAEVEPEWLSVFCASLPNEAIEHYSPLEANVAGKRLESQQQAYDLPLALFARNLAATSFNLRQGAFQYKKKSAGQWKTWRPAIAATIACLVFSLTLKGVELYRVSTSVDDTREQVIATYQAAFPGSKVRPHLIRSMLKNKLAELEGGPETSFLSLAENLADVIAQTSDFKPETLRYDRRRNELRIRASASDFQTFSKVKSLLEQQGVSVEQGSLNSDEGTVIGEIRIKGAA